MAHVVVGSGAAGIQAATRLCQLDREVILVSREKRAYSLCSLPYILSGEYPEERLFTYGEKDFREMGITPFLGREARRVDSGKKLLILDDGTELAYDCLLIATGSVPFVPSGLRADVPGMFFFNSLEDTRKLVRAAERRNGAGWQGTKGAGEQGNKGAVVIGAGFSGLECAYALCKRGLDVTVVEMEDRVLPRILDRDMSPPVEELLWRNGVDVRLKSKVLGFEPSGGRILVGIVHEELGETEKEEIMADFVVLCLGVRPDVALAEAAGAKVDRGIVVGPDMQTSVPGIYAAGDVAEFDGSIPATWLTAAIQGGVAASSMAGVKAEFTHLDQVNIATLFGVPVVGIGTPEACLKGAQARLLKKEDVWRKVIKVDGKVAGYQSVGSLDIRGLSSLIARELSPLQEYFAGAGMHHPSLACAPLFGLRPGPARAPSRIRRPRDTPSS